MPVQPLPTIPDGSDVFLDANVFIYGLSGESADCRALLARCNSEQITGVTSFHVVSEVTHRLMCKEAQAKGLAGVNPVRTLKEHPERVRSLVDYWSELDRLLALNILFLTVNEEVIRRANGERQRYGLINSDSIIVAFLSLYGLSILASRDADFGNVANVAVYSPTDV